MEWHGVNKGWDEQEGGKLQRPEKVPLKLSSLLNVRRTDQ